MRRRQLILEKKTLTMIPGLSDVHLSSRNSGFSLKGSGHALASRLDVSEGTRLTVKVMKG